MGWSVAANGRGREGRLSNGSMGLDAAEKGSRAGIVEKSAICYDYISRTKPESGAQTRKINDEQIESGRV
jgi:hypothetical protein